VVPDAASVSGDSSLHVPQSQFAVQLEALQKTHEIVSLASVWQEARTKRPRAVITFDDACRGAVTAGVAELKRRGLPATIFVAPGLLGRGPFWWDQIADDSGAVPPAAREHALRVLAGRADAVIEWARAERRPVRDVPSHQHAATETELADAASSGLITFGGHSWSHPNLSVLAADDLIRELVRPLAWLRDRFVNVVPWLAYPYGRHTRAVEQAAEVAGYDGALLIDGGVASIQWPARYRVPRINIAAGVTLHGFEMRTAGLVS
jgi:peptidoglycan/xylan/chitin deacetylase (PgdA/CDA1 family)